MMFFYEPVSEDSISIEEFPFSFNVLLGELPMNIETVNKYLLTLLDDEDFIIMSIHEDNKGIYMVLRFKNQNDAFYAKLRIDSNELDATNESNWQSIYDL